MTDLSDVRTVLQRMTDAGRAANEATADLAAITNELTRRMQERTEEPR